MNPGTSGGGGSSSSSSSSSSSGATGAAAALGVTRGLGAAVIAEKHKPKPDKPDVEYDKIYALFTHRLVPPLSIAQPPALPCAQHSL
jgi:hypothetical protein